MYDAYVYICITVCISFSIIYIAPNSISSSTGLAHLLRSAPGLHPVAAHPPKRTGRKHYDWRNFLAQYRKSHFPFQAVGETSMWSSLPLSLSFTFLSLLALPLSLLQLSLSSCIFGCLTFGIREGAQRKRLKKVHVGFG